MKNSKGIIGYFASHPTAANLLMIIFLGVGVFASPKLIRETFSDFSPTEVEVLVIYPGATAADVEEGICQRIESSLDGLIDVEEIRSEAREGLGRIVVEMREGGDLQPFIDDIKSKVDAIDDFPSGADDPVISQLGQSDMVVSIAVSGPMSDAHLKMYCEQLKENLLQVETISEVDVDGFSGQQIAILLDAVTLLQFGLSTEKIANAISMQNVNLPAGSISTSDSEVLVRFSDERKVIHELEDLIVSSGPKGAEVRLGDIARITHSFEFEEEKIIFNGQRAGVLVIKKTKHQDALRTLDDVKRFIDAENRVVPEGVSLTLTQDVTSIVSDRLMMLVINGIEGLVLVFLTMWLFFNLRLSFWVSMGLPVSFLGTVFLMYITGVTLNMLSMVGLLLALGLIMDDAIVISENVATHLQKGKSPLRAAIDGTREVAVGVFSSFLTTVLIFGTLAFMITGSIGKVLWAMPAVLIMTLIVSLAEAFFILPNHLAHSMAHKPQKTNPFRKKFNAAFDRVKENAIGKTVDFAIQWRYVFVSVVVTVLLLSLGMIAGGVLKTEAFPDVEGDVLEARVLLPQGTPLKRTEEIVSEMTDSLSVINKRLSLEEPDGESLVKSVTVQYSKNRDSNESGAHVATITVDLLSSESRHTRLEELTALWRGEVHHLTDVLAITFKEPAIGPSGLAIDVRLQGGDLDKIKQASNDLMAWFNRYDGVVDIMDDFRPGKPEIKASIKNGAKVLGLESAQISRQLRSAFYGTSAGEVMVGAESYDIDVRLAPGEKDSFSDLENFYITTPKDKTVPLGEVANLETTRGYARIARVNSVKTITVRGDVDTKVANAAEIIAETKGSFLPVLKAEYPSVSVAFQGQDKESAKTGASITSALIFAILGVFVILSFQFRGYIEPFVVLAAIPLAFIGVVWGHLALGLNLSMVSIMGFASLAGVVVNDSILLVEFIKLRLGDGEDVSVAAATASRQRFRAVLLTSVTTIAGLVPLLSETSVQAQTLIPLATSLVFGLLTSTFLVLIITPCIYTILDDFGLANKINQIPNA